MKCRMHGMGLALVGILLFASITATLAAPQHAPLLQQTETEPNDDFGQANSASIPGYVRGTLSNSNRVDPSLDIQDYFKAPNSPGRTYQANLSAIQNPGAMMLRLRLYDGNQNLVTTSAASTSTGSVEWTANTSLYYIRVEALQVTTSTIVIANYQLDIDELAGTPTPGTPTPGLDRYEPNNSRSQAFILPVATSASALDANFHAQDDEDWFGFYSKSGRDYQTLTSNLMGVDTFVQVYRDDGSLVKSDNDGAGGFASKVEWQASYDGWYYIRVTNLVSSSGSNRYDVTASEVSAPATATPATTPGPAAGIDGCEDNSTFDRACTIAANQAQTYNFISPHSGPDNDYFKVWIKASLIFTCKTSNLSPGVDPNMIAYDGNRNPIGGNDDVAPGDYNSRLSYYATYTGWLYILVGYGDRTPSSFSSSNYNLQCDTGMPGQSTPTAVALTPEPTRTPGPQATPTPQPVATAANLTVRLLSTPAPASAATPAPRFLPVNVLAYYDANDDGQPGAGEGIIGVSVQAYDALTGQLLAQGFTDDRGYLEFTVSVQGPVRVSVPFFGFSQLVAGEGASIYVRVAPRASLEGAQ